MESKILAFKYYLSLLHILLQQHIMSLFIFVSYSKVLLNWKTFGEPLIFGQGVKEILFADFGLIVQTKHHIFSAKTGHTGYNYDNFDSMQ